MVIRSLKFRVKARSANEIPLKHWALGGICMAHAKWVTLLTECSVDTELVIQAMVRSKLG